MLPAHIKIVLFLALWHEMAAQFRIGVDGAFVASLAVFFGTWLVQQFAVEFTGMSGPMTARVFAWGTLWIALFCWLAPAIVWSLPITIVIAGVVGLVLVGVRCRQEFEQRGETLGKAWFHDRSEAVVVALFSALAVAFLSRRHWGSALPLAGYIALLVLPVSFGWIGAGPQPDTKFDASFGDEDMFHDVGVSDDD